VFSMIDAQQFQLAFWEWVCAVNELIQGQVVNIDGKCLRGSNDEKLGKRAIYMVSAWAVENEDVALNEDHSRVRKDQAPENLAILRHIALNLLKQEKTAKGGIHAKQLQAGWKEDYLLKVLASEI
jgi:hypothetical protein